MNYWDPEGLCPALAAPLFFGGGSISAGSAMTAGAAVTAGGVIVAAYRDGVFERAGNRLEMQLVTGFTLEQLINRLCLLIQNKQGASVTLVLLIFPMLKSKIVEGQESFRQKREDAIKRKKKQEVYVIRIKIEAATNDWPSTSHSEI